MGFANVLGAAALFASTASGYWLRQVGNASLPVVDLGYELHQASNFNETGRFYNFSNIRYAAPPVRFAPPTAPAENRAQINDGSYSPICPQAAPAWNSIATTWLTDLIIGQPFTDTTPYVAPGASWNLTLPTPSPQEHEDCLFLDVFVPQKILQNAGNYSSGGAPVLVWIYGGGYTAGNKNNNPAGLLAASGNVTEGEVIYVALNYRLGAFGWSCGPSFQAEGGTSNVGLYDQRFALEWVQKYIHLFGGDPDRVTVFGESAGGGSIMHQITAYGGLKGKVPFAGAVPQSPGWLQASSQLQQEDVWQALLALTNTTSLEELRALPEADFMKASALMVTYNSSYGGYSYGPVVDGSFVPLETGQLLAQGRFDKSVKTMVGHNTLEGVFFTPPYINSTAKIQSQLRGTFPYMPQKSLDHITNVLYPAVFDGTYPYTNQYGRADLIVSEAVFTCNTYFLSTGFDNKTYSYLFNVPPAFHGFDVAYTYYDGGATSTVNPLMVTNRTIAIALQDFITSFAINGKPSAEGIRQFNTYGPNARVLDLNITDIGEVHDGNVNERCAWWQKALIT